MIATISQRINSPTRIPDMFFLPWSRRSPRADRLEFANLFRERPLHRQALHRGCAIEAMAVAGILHDECGVRGLRDGAAVREHQNVPIDAERCRRPGVDTRRTVLELGCGVRADRPAGSETEVKDDDISTRDRHRRGLRLAED